MTMQGIEAVYFPDAEPPWSTLRRRYEEAVYAPREGEAILRTLGQYAICQQGGEQWQLMPAEKQASLETDTWQWATPEDMRTMAGRGKFLETHMDLLEAQLYAHRRITNPGNKINISSRKTLQMLLADHGIDVSIWDPSATHDLYDDLAPAQGELENVSLHSVDGHLWIATAQTMLNVYHVTSDGATQKLRETWKTRYNDAGKPTQRVRSTIRSSIGETGHLVDGHPERPFATALRGLQEELGVIPGEILVIRSTDSLLRQKNSHHRFSSVRAEDHTHYFMVVLKSESVHEKYVNKEKDAAGRVYEVVELEWCTHDGLLV